MYTWLVCASIRGGQSWFQQTINDNYKYTGYPPADAICGTDIKRSTLTLTSITWHNLPAWEDSAWNNLKARTYLRNEKTTMITKFKTASRPPNFSVRESRYGLHARTVRTRTCSTCSASVAMDSGRRCGRILSSGSPRTEGSLKLLLPEIAALIFLLLIRYLVKQYQ